MIDRNVIELNVKEIGLTLPKTSTKKIGELIPVTNGEVEKLTTKKDIVDKINELVREVNCLKRNQKC